MRCTRSIAAVAALGTLVLSVLSGCSGGEPDVVTHRADYPAYGSRDELIKSADLVVRGNVVSSRVEELRPEVSTEGDPLTNPQAGLSPEEANEVRESPAVVTVTTVRVAEVIKGDATVGDVIDVSQLGGEKAGVRYRDEGTTLPPSDTKSDYVLFLAAFGDGKPYDLLNPRQAMYKVAAGGALQPVGDGVTAVTTVDDLRAAAARAK